MISTFVFTSLNPAYMELIDMLCQCLAEASRGSLSSLVPKGCGIIDLNATATLEVIAGSTVLKTLERGNDFGGMSDLLATSIHTCTEVGGAGGEGNTLALCRTSTRVSPPPRRTGASCAFGVVVCEYPCCVRPRKRM